MSERPNVEGIRKTYAEDIDLRTRAVNGVTLLGSEDIVNFCDYALALESRCADKDASIQQLIEQLEKAEAQITDLARLAAVDIAQDRAGRIEDLEKWAGVVLFELEAGPSAQRDRLIREGVTLLNTPARTLGEAK